MNRHPLAGKTVVLNSTAADPSRGQVVSGAHFTIEDYWHNVSGQSWMVSAGNPAAMNYAMRVDLSVPCDDEVVYGKIGPFGHLVHVSELGPVV